MPQDRQTLVIENAEQLLTAPSRRGFLRALAAGSSVMFLPSVFAACGDDDDSVAPPGVRTAVLDLADDRGIINYLYAIEQFTAEFYVRVVQESTAAGFNAIQRRLLQDVRNHEFIHAESLRALVGIYRLPELRIDRSFDDTNFRSPVSILERARTMEDLTVSAYNNALRHLTDAANVLLVGKIASVEARHSSIVRDLLDDLTTDTGTMFAADDIVDENGLDNKDLPTTPSAVLAEAATYFDATITITNSPA